MKHETYELTSLGRAVVEALPDRKLVAKVKRYYKQTGKLPKEFNTDGTLKNEG